MFYGFIFYVSFRLIYQDHFQTSMETAPWELCVSCALDIFKVSGL